MGEHKAQIRTPSRAMVKGVCCVYVCVRVRWVGGKGGLLESAWLKGVRVLGGVGWVTSYRWRCLSSTPSAPPYSFAARLRGRTEKCVGRGESEGETKGRGTASPRD